MSKRLERQRRHLAKFVSSTFVCGACGHEAVFLWAALGSTAPPCPACGGQLVLVEAVRGKGVLPPASTYPGPTKKV